MNLTVKRGNVLICAMSISKHPKVVMTEIGKIGGTTTLQRYGTSYFSELSKKRKSFKGGRKRKKKAAK
jgi:hypothetical protein